LSSYHGTPFLNVSSKPGIVFKIIFLTFLQTDAGNEGLSGAG
jgi:hypothetical protein